MSNLSQLTRPMRPRPRGLSARFYWVVLIAAVLMIGLQVVPLLHGRASAEADASAAQAPPAEAQSAAPAAPQSEPQAATDAAAAITSETPSTTQISHPATATDEASSATDSAAAATPDAQSPAPSPSEPTPTAPSKVDETAALWPGLTDTEAPLASAADSAAADKADTTASVADLALSSSATRPALMPPEPSREANAPSKPNAQRAKSENVWTGVIRMISAVTRVKFEAPSHATQDATAETSLVEEAPLAVPEDEPNTWADPPAGEVAQPGPLADVTAPPAAVQPINPPEEPRVVIENPANSGGTIHYLVDGEMEALRPGETQTLRPGASRVLFHRGGDFGNFDSVLREGKYQFRATRQGWTLTQ